jgi:hypothetical protein
MAAELPKTKDELVERIRSARAELQETLDRLSDEQLAQPGPDGGWSAKDHLAHIAAWHRHAVSIVSGEQPYDTFGMGEKQLNAMGLDEINAAIFEQNRALALPGVLAAFNGAHEKMLALVESLDDADLTRPYFRNEPTITRTTVDGIANNSYLHDAEHAGMLRSQLSH